MLAEHEFRLPFVVFRLTGNYEAYSAELCKNAQLVALQDARVHPRKLNLASSLRDIICSFSLSYVDEARKIRAGRLHAGLLSFGNNF